MSSSQQNVLGELLDITTSGSGRPILFLHSEMGPHIADSLVRELAKFGNVIAPVHPGFGPRGCSAQVTSVDDVSYLYLELLDQLRLKDVLIVGISLGAWLAAEMAIKSTYRLSKIVFVAPVGIVRHDGGADTEILDLFSTPMVQFGRAAFHDPSTAARAIRPFSEDDQMWVARAREATALLAWSPYMHNPKLLKRLGRVSTPALCLWGDADGVVRREYAQEFAAAMPDCTFQVLADVGHYPEVERPSDVTAQVATFLRKGADIREPAEVL